MNTPLKFINHRIEEYAMQVTFEPKRGTGSVVYNLSLIKEEDLAPALSVIRDTCQTGVSPSSLIGIRKAGETIDNFTVPDGKTAILTMCSTTLDGLLIRRGIPCSPIGGGVVEIIDNMPRRFTHLIRYNCTTIDPLQVLISHETTSVTKVMETGTGSVLANIRECHMEAESLVETTLEELTATYFTGVLELGLPNTPSLGVKVDTQYMGVVTLGGTNQMAALKESGFWVQTLAMKGLIDVSELSFIDDY